VAGAVKVKLEADVGRVGVGGGDNNVIWFIGGRARQTVPKALRMALRGAASWYLQEKRSKVPATN
jgi:hypothetical protein